KASRNHGAGLDGLLIEISAHFAAPIKTMTTNRPEVAFLGGLQLDQPFEGLQTGIDDVLLARVGATDEQGLGEPGVIVGHSVFAPGPIVLDALLKAFQESLGQSFAGLSRE